MTTSVRLAMIYVKEENDCQDEVRSIEKGHSTGDINGDRWQKVILTPHQQFVANVRERQLPTTPNRLNSWATCAFHSP